MTWFRAIIALALLIVFLCVTYFRSPQKNIIRGHDDSHYFACVRSMGIDHNLGPASKYPIGLPILALPFFLLAHLITLATGMDASGHSNFYQATVCFGSILYGAIGLVLTYRLLAKRFPEKTALLAIGITLLASNLIYYFVREPFMAHLASFFAVSLMLYLLDNGAHPLAIGATFGLAVLVRPQDAVFVVIPLILLPWHKWPLMVVGCAGVASLHFLAGHALYPGEPFYWTSPKILEVLFSTKHGLISWHPVILMALVGLGLLIRQDRRLGIALGLAFLAQLYVAASWHQWWFGVSFGHRAFVSCTPIFALGLATLLEKARESERLRMALPAFGVLIAWNAVVMFVWLAGWVPHQDYL